MTSLEIRALMALEITAISSCIRSVQDTQGLTIIEPDEQDHQEQVQDRWGDRTVPKRDYFGWSDLPLNGGN